MSDDTEDLKAKLLKKSRPEPTIKGKNLLSTGSTLLNLACSGRFIGGFPKGHYVWFVGDSDSGKTFLTLTCFAEASISEHFKDYRFIYNSPEDGALMDLTYFFGKAVQAKIEVRQSFTAEEFYYDVIDTCKEGHPCIYVLDSADALSTDAEVKKFNKRKKAHAKGEEAAGIMTDGKAKVHSANLRQVLGWLKKTGSILIIISQSRDAIGSMFEKSTHSGGKALKFYATLQIWTTQMKKETKKVKDKTRQIGIISKIRVKKNRITGKDRTIQVPIYHSFGIDDIGSCIEYLLSEGHWKKNADGINAKEFSVRLRKEALIKHIEKKGLEQELRMLVGRVWKEIEDACTVERKRRYV
jgi:RecA/RadA recombinase